MCGWGGVGDLDQRQKRESSWTGRGRAESVESGRGWTDEVRGQKSWGCEKAALGGMNGGGEKEVAALSQNPGSDLGGR